MRPVTIAWYSLFLDSITSTCQGSSQAAGRASRGGRKNPSDALRAVDPGRTEKRFSGHCRVGKVGDDNDKAGKGKQSRLKGERAGICRRATERRGGGKRWDFKTKLIQAVRANPRAHLAGGMDTGLAAGQSHLFDFRAADTGVHGALGGILPRRGGRANEASLEGRVGERERIEGGRGAGRGGGGMGVVACFLPHLAADTPWLSARPAFIPGEAGVVRGDPHTAEVDAAIHLAKGYIWRLPCRVQRDQRTKDHELSQCAQLEGDGDW